MPQRTTSMKTVRKRTRSDERRTARSIKWPAHAPRALRHRRHADHRRRRRARRVRGRARGDVRVSRRSPPLRFLRPHGPADHAHGAARRRALRRGDRRAHGRALDGVPRASRDADAKPRPRAAWRCRVARRSRRCPRCHARPAHRQHRAGRTAEAGRRGSQSLLPLRRVRQRLGEARGAPADRRRPRRGKDRHRLPRPRRRHRRRLDLRRSLRRPPRRNDDRHRLGQNSRCATPRRKSAPFFLICRGQGAAARSDRRMKGRPEPGEYGPHAEADIAQVVGDDAVAALAAQALEVEALFGNLSDAAITNLRYAPGKWTPKEILGHLIDDERIFAYRALCIARGDTRPLPSFEQGTLADLLHEYKLVRAATLALFTSLTAEAWLRRGTVTDYTASVRGLAFHIAGHELHHLRVLRHRYL